jgi:hypothetical protein
MTAKNKLKIKKYGKAYLMANNNDTINQKYRSKEHSMGYITTDPMPSQEYLLKFYEEIYFKELPSASYNLEYSTEELEHKKLRAKTIVHTTSNLLKNLLTK